MRMRKLPWAEDYIEAADIVCKDPTINKGLWKQQLQGQKLHVEIGTGKGDYWISMGCKNLQDAWVGVEKNINVAAMAVKKFNEDVKQASSMRFICGDAELIEEWFASNEIDVIHLNFSDPWPKKRAHKKRLSHQSFIERYGRILADDGEIQMKTDNASLFEFSVLQFQEVGWFLHELSVDFRRMEHKEDAITEYEQRFMSKGQPIYRAVWKKYPYVNPDAKKRG